MPLNVSAVRSSSRFVPTISNTAITATVMTVDTSSDSFYIEPFNMATLFLKTASVTGTSPTLVVRVQKLLADNTTWQDIAAFASVNGTASRVLELTSGGSQESAQAARSLAAGTINSVPFGRTWRLDFDLGGTNPSFTVSVWLEAM